MSETGELSGTFSELLKLSRSADDFLPVFRRVLEHLTKTTVCRHPRIVWYPERCPLLDRRAGVVYGSGEALASLTLEGFPADATERRLIFSLPLHSRGRVFGRFEVYGLEQDTLPDSDYETARGFAEILTSVIAGQLSRLDAVTRLYTREALTERLPRLLDEARRQGAGLSLMMVDLDHFKSVNDTYGHAVGDRALGMAADVLRQITTDGGFAARYGGEEMVVVLPGGGYSGAEAAEKARETIARTVIPVPEKGLSFHLNASFGVAVYPAHGTTVDELMRRADEALYHAKDAGRNRVMVAGSPPKPYTLKAPVPPTFPVDRRSGGGENAPRRPTTITTTGRPERRRNTEPPPKPPPPTRRPSLDSLLRERLSAISSGASIRVHDLSADPRLGLQKLKPYCVDADSDRLFIIEFYQNRVHWLSLKAVEFLCGGSSLSRRGPTVTTLGVEPGAASLDHPIAVATDTDGYIWVADTESDLVKQYDPDGFYMDRSFGGPGDGTGSLMQPQDLAFYGELLMVADSGNRRIQGYGPSGRWDFEIGVKPAPGGFRSQPSKMALGNDGRIFVLDKGSSRIVIYDHQRRYLGELSDYGSAPGQLRSPNDLLVTAEGVLVVAEGGDNFRLQFFNAASPITAPDIRDDVEGVSFTAAVNRSPLEHLGVLELGVTTLVGDLMHPLAPTRYGEPNVERLRPWSIAGGTLAKLFMVDQDKNRVLELRLLD